MSLSRVSKTRGRIASVKPVAACVVLSVVVTLIVICVISVIFALLESVAKNAVGPLSIAAAAVGCFVGAYVCAGIVHGNGLVIGGVIGFANYLFVFFVACFEPGFSFGSAAVIKLIIFVAAGCCGGYIGANRRCCGKKRK